jgi:hypothetical protein
MSTNWDAELDDDTEETPLVKKLRKALDKANSQLAEIRGNERKQTIQRVITEKGLDERVAALIPSDADPGEWLTTYGDLFGSKPKDAETDETTEDAKQEPDEQTLPAAQPGGLTPEEVEQLRAMQGLDLTRHEAPTDASEKIKGFATPEELNQYINSLKGIG